MDDLGRTAEAEPLKREVYEVSKRTLGADHPDTLLALYNWCISLDKLGRTAEAEPLWRHCVEGNARKYGNEHSETVDAKQGLARCLKSQGKPQ